MISDLRTILDGWEYEPGRISCRRIIGRDGREKIQTRIDLGVMQFESNGRPDGQRPGGYESLLDQVQHRLREHNAIHGNDEDFVLSPEECRELRHEAYLYYQRYLALFVLEEFDGVARDTARNLQVIDICERYAGAATDRELLRAQRAYVVMMHARARAQLALAAGEPETALDIVQRGLAEVERAAAQCAEGGGCESELRALRAVHAEILARLPEDAPPRLQTELAAALAVEDYERAAALRDQLKVRRAAGPARSAIA